MLFNDTVLLKEREREGLKKKKTERKTLSLLVQSYGIKCKT